MRENAPDKRDCLLAQKAKQPRVLFCEATEKPYLFYLRGDFPQGGAGLAEIPYI
jgi:hypothetical protein